MLTSDVETWAATPYGHLDCLYVVEKYRKAGVGRLLMDAVILYAQDQGFGELQWQLRPGMTRQSGSMTGWAGNGKRNNASPLRYAKELARP